MHKLTLRQRIYFGVGKFGTAIFMQVVTIATVYIYGSAFQLDYKLNAIGNAVGKIFIAFSGFIFGYISDILKNPRWGRRKFFVWTGTPILAVSFVMLFIPHFFIPLDKEMLVFAWLLIWYAIFNLFYGYITTPYQAWMPEVTTEDDRVGMSAIQNTTNLFATIGGLAFAFIFSGMLDAEIEKVGPTAILGDLGIILLVAVLIFAIIEVVAFIPALISIKEEPVERKERDILREFKIVLTNRNYVLWFITQGIYSMGLTILTALTFDLIGFLGLTGMLDFAIFAIAMFGTTMLSFIFWEKMSKRIGKRFGLLLSYGCLILILPLTLVLGKIPFIPDNVETWIFGLLLGFGLSTTYLFPNAIIGDLADEDERITKESRAGMYTGFNSIPLNIFQATAYLLVPFIYNPEPGATYWGLQWLGPAVAFFFLLSIPTIIIGNYDPFIDLIKASAKAKTLEEQ
jgi:GPH family glycoside/pentoside/hexuronide:cation symporter